MQFLVIDPRTKTAVSTHATLAEAIPHWAGKDIMVGTRGDRKTLRQWREDAGAYDPNREAYEHAMQLHTIPESHLDHQVSAEHIEWAKGWSCRPSSPAYGRPYARLPNPRSPTRSARRASAPRAQPATAWPGRAT